jgi:hypothetical protein
MLAFYVGTGIALALFVGGWFAWTPLRTWYEERQTVQAYFRGLDKAVSIDVFNESTGQVIGYALTGLGATIENAEGINWEKRVDLTYTDVPVAVILEEMCQLAGASWTIAKQDDGLCRTPALRLVIAGPARIAELEKANPRVTALVHDYRERLAEEASKVKQGRGAE